MIRWMVFVLAAHAVTAQDFLYTVRPLPAADGWSIEMSIRTSLRGDALFALPTWAPGSYRMVHFARWVDSLQAFDEHQRPLKVTPQSDRTWKIAKAQTLRTIRYFVRDIDEDTLATLPTTLSDFRSNYFFANGPALFGYLEGQKEKSCGVVYRLPEGWNVWCALDSVGPIHYQAPSYDHLIDAPVMGGSTGVESSTVWFGGKKYVFVSVSESPVSLDTLWAIAQPFVESQTAMMQEQPYADYYFLFRFSSEGTRFGALEHARSSAYYLPQPRRKQTLRGTFYQEVMSHEFFHLWNPKRIFPVGLGPFDYRRPLKMRAMWLIEGATEYYAQLSLVRAGQKSEKSFWRQLGRWCEDPSEGPLEELSLAAGERGVAASMYTKGALVSFLLDAEIRHQTQNEKSLDDVFLHLNREFAAKGKPYSDKALPDIILRATGADVETLYMKHIASDEEPPLEELFAKAGLLYRRTIPGFMGWIMDIDAESRLYVSGITEGYSAQKMGLLAGDVMMTMNGLSIPKDPDKIRDLLFSVDSAAVGSPLSFQVERNGTELDLKGFIMPGPVVEIVVDPLPDPTPLQQSILRSLVTGKN